MVIASFWNMLEGEINVDIFVNLIESFSNFIYLRDCTIAFRGHSNDAVLLLKQFEIGVLPPHQRIYRYPGMIRISESKPE